MQRRTFIAAVATAVPLFAFSASFRGRIIEQKKGFVVQSGKSRFGIPTPFKGVNPNDLKLSSKDTGGKLSAFEYAGVEKVGPSFHAHAKQDEIFYVIEGDYLFKVGEEKQMLHGGDLIFLPRNIAHTWVQMSDKGKLFYWLQPAGKMEEFFMKMTEMNGKGTPKEFEEIGLSHGIQNFGPPLSATEEHQLSDKLSNGFITKASKGRFEESTKLGGLSPNDIKVSSKDTNGELTIFEYAGNEKGGPPLHIHPEQDEIFYVMDGEYLFQVGEERHQLKIGDMIFLPRGLPHTFAQLTEKGKMLFFFQPSGKMEDFFRVIGALKSAPSFEEGARIFENHNMKVVGAPLSY